MVVMVFIQLCWISAEPDQGIGIGSKFSLSGGPPGGAMYLGGGPWV